MKRLFAIWLLIAASAMADPVKVKLGTLAPKDS
jgi:hypothetical protein